MAKRKLASVVRIASCEPIPDTERLSVATMEGKGWNVVTGRNEFCNGDIGIYFEIDSFLPSDDERYAFLAERCTRRILAKDGTELDKGIRIRTMKLRGVVSQGLIMPLDKFPEITSRIGIKKDGEMKTEMLINSQRGEDEPLEQELVGADVASLLRVRHYDEVVEQWADQCQGSCGVPFDAYGKFPTSYAPKTDEERCQNVTECFTTMVGRKFEVTEKSDGMSCTMMYCPSADDERPFRVCSRNNDLKRETAQGVSPLWLIAEKYEVEKHLKEHYAETGEELAIQGEYVGIGIQKNRDKLKTNDWLVFRIFDIKAQKFVSPQYRRELCAKWGLHHVRVIDESMDVFAKFHTCDELLKFAEGKTANGNEREGLVFKASDGLEPFVSFKAVSNRYLLKQED